jgi:DnaJ-class molecular chaperone
MGRTTEGVSMKTIKARCPVCRGTGMKGHGFWNVLTDCPVCLGEGKVEVHAPKPPSKRDLWREFVIEEARS